MKTLAALLPGEWGYAGEHTVKRLKQLGLHTGTKVICLQRSPLCDPVMYEFRGSVFAIRTKDAENIPIITKEEKTWD